MSSIEAVEVEYVHCNLCGRDTTAPFHKSGNWQVVRCTHCDLKYLNPRPTGSQLTKLYSANYFDSHYTQDDIEDQIQRNIYLVTRYEQVLGKKGSLLDVGCGYGFLVAAAQRLDWDAKGIDISEEAVAFGTTKVGANLEKATPESWIADKPYDVVVSSHSLEHVSDPRQTLQKLKSFMQPTGSVLHIRVPNVESVDRRWHGNRWWAWDAPFHLYFFEPKTLTALLNQVGFKDLTVRNHLFDPFSHLLADLQTGKFRNDGPEYNARAAKARQGFLQQILHFTGRAYAKVAYRLKLTGLLADRDFEVWARSNE